MLSLRESRQYASTNDSAIVKEVQDRVLNTTKSSTKSDQCDKIYSQPQFIIESPNYPSNYPPNLQCSYILKGSNCETTFQFQFLDFFLEKSLGCANDRLEVQNLDALCGSMQGAKNYVTKNGILELRLITDSDNSGRGFRILVSRNICVPTVVPPPVDRPKEQGDNDNRNANIPIPPVATPEPRRPCNHPPQSDPGYNYNPPDGGFTPSTLYPYLPPIYPTAPIYPILPPTVPTSGTNYLCCESSYSEKRFYLASPGFPYSNNHPTDCVYNIFRSNAKICRLRINFHFFWVGNSNQQEQQQEACNNGFLEVDGKHICGCHTGMKLISPFDGRFSDRKMIRFRNVGLPRSIFSGFAIEVTQDECPKRYSPNANATTTERTFTFYNDQNNRVAWPNITRSEDTIKRAVLVSENTEIIDTQNGRVSTGAGDTTANGSDRLIKSVYFFDYDDYYDQTPKFNKPRDVEETAYVDTQDIATSFSGFGADDSHKCRMWGVLQWTLLTKDLLWQRMPKCNTVTSDGTATTPNVAVHEPCREFNFAKGFFQTPGYPFSYPANMNLCYRFVKQQGFCKLKLYFVDFHVEDSVDCRKDYLQHENYRYCGGKLFNTISHFDISNKRHEQIRFITDSSFSGRGFKGIYEQIPCVMQTPPPSKWPATYLPPTQHPFYPTTTPIAPPPVNNCHRDIQDSTFNIGVYDYGTRHCTFVVHKSTPDVCQLQLVFITFDLICGQEYFLLNNMQYCGRLSGQTILLDYRTNDIVLTYYGANARFRNLKLHIAGTQINTNCGNENNPDDTDFDLPPAQRIMNHQKMNVVALDRGRLTAVTKNKTESDIHLILKKQYKEICGVLMNIQKVKFRDALCNLLVNNRRNIECTPLTNNTIYVPYNKLQKLELNFKKLEEVMNIEFKEISCNSKQVLI